MLFPSSQSSVCWAIAALSVGAIVSSAVPAQAFALQLGPITFTEFSGDFRITGGFRDGSFYNIQQEVFGPNINLVMTIDGFPRIWPEFIGIRIQSFVTNLTNTPWIFFDHEVREILGVSSPEADGLSFAQGIRSVRPFISSHFASANEVTDVRDFVNFSQGVVNPGETVVFQYAITDRSPINRFYLLQRPNFAPGGVGFVPVAPLAPPPPPPPVVIVPPPPPPPEPVVIVPPPVVVPPPPAPEPPPPAPPEPEPVVITPVTPPPAPASEAVPEPATLLGMAMVAALGGWFRRHRKVRNAD